MEEYVLSAQLDLNNISASVLHEISHKMISDFTHPTTTCYSIIINIQ